MTTIWDFENDRTARSLKNAMSDFIMIDSTRNALPYLAIVLHTQM
jgi:hypothetical protein